MVAIDSFEFTDVDLIKIDVEGYEMEVLKGAKQTISTCKYLMIELNNNTKKYGSNNLEIENYLNNDEWCNFGLSYEEKISEQITKRFISDGLNKITEVWGLEVGLILDKLYAGTADCVGNYSGIPSLIDFKTAKKIKKREWIEDYFLQGCAYANAHNVMFESDIKQIVILMVDRDLIFKEFVVGENEFNHLTAKWKQRLIAFDKKYNK